MNWYSVSTDLKTKLSQDDDDLLLPKLRRSVYCSGSQTVPFGPPAVFRWPIKPFQCRKISDYLFLLMPGWPYISEF